MVLQRGISLSRVQQIEKACSRVESESVCDDVRVLHRTDHTCESHSRFCSFWNCATKLYVNCSPGLQVFDGVDKK
jgi:hypothetical protein